MHCGAHRSWRRPVNGPDSIAFPLGKPSFPHLIAGALRRLANVTDETFLRHRGNEGAVARVNKPTGEPEGSARARAVLGVEQPLVGPERAMKPQGVVEARGLDGSLEHRATV